VDRFEIDSLVASLDHSAPSALHVRLTGRSDSRDAPRALTPLLDAALAAARAEDRVLVVHFEKLAYFNSSTLAALVQLIRAAQAARIGLTLVYDRTQRWQVTSFDALRRALGTVDARGAPPVHFSAA
jgi:hypothetical protein